MTTRRAVLPHASVAGHLAKLEPLQRGTAAWTTQRARIVGVAHLRGRLELRGVRGVGRSHCEVAEPFLLLQTIITELKRPLRGVLGWFVACFTEDGDDLSQWRGYGGGEGGYLIEFDSV